MERGEKICRNLKKLWKKLRIFLKLQICPNDKQLGLNIEFIEYKKNIDYTKTLDQINNELLLMLGKQIRSSVSTTHKYSASWKTIPNESNNNENDRYGGLMADDDRPNATDRYGGWLD